MKIRFILFLISISIYFNQLSANDIKLFKSKLYLATKLKEYGYYKRSLKHYNYLIKKNNSDYLKIDMAILNYKIDNKNKGLKILNSVANNKPNNLRIAEYLGKILYDLGEYENSKKYLEKVIKLKKEISIYKLLALIEDRVNNPQNAIKYYKIIVKIFNKKEYYLNLAILFEQIKDIKNSKFFYEEYYKHTNRSKYSVRFLLRFYKRYGFEKEYETIYQNHIKKDKKIMRKLLKSRR